MTKFAVVRFTDYRKEVKFEIVGYSSDESHARTWAKDLCFLSMGKYKKSHNLKFIVQEIECHELEYINVKNSVAIYRGKELLLFSEESGEIDGYFKLIEDVEGSTKDSVSVSEFLESFDIDDGTENFAKIAESFDIARVIGSRGTCTDMKYTVELLNFMLEHDCGLEDRHKRISNIVTSSHAVVAIEELN
eukprot:gene30458-36813_t